jgi:Tfp pilus assembly protein PilO
MRGNLRDVRVQLLIIVGILLLVDLVAIVVLVSPTSRSRGAEFERLRLEKIDKTRASASARGMDEKITTAREQEATFNEERLASRYSTMSEQISHIAKEAGVSVANVKYDENTTDKSTPSGYDEIGISIQIRGSYDQNIRFINAVERQKLMLLIDGVSFGGMQGDSLTVSVHLSTFLRSAA